MNTILNKNNIWIFAREEGYTGIVIAETLEDALNELRKIYNDIDERLDPNNKEYNWGLSIRPIDDYEFNGNVIIVGES